MDQCDRPYPTRTLDTFLGLLRGCERRGDSASAEAVLAHMAEFGLEANLYAYNLAMQTYGKAGLVAPAQRMMQARAHVPLRISRVLRSRG